MDSYKHLIEYLSEELKSFNSKLQKQPQELYQPMQYIFGLGGKHVRPLLTLIGNDLFNGKKEDAVPAMLAVECFHNFSLMHDDIMDAAPLRRGQQTVHLKWNHNIALLSGDGLLVTAYRTLCNSNQKYLAQLLNSFNTTALEVCEGQQFDMNFENKADVSVEEYLNMISLKTAVLLGCSLQMGAITAGAQLKDQEHVYEFGKHVGIAFQLMDDLLDVYGQQHKIGKQEAGDIILNKKTFLLIQALYLANPEQKKIIENWLNKKEFDPKEKIEAIKSIYDAISVREKTENEMNKHFQEALRHLELIDCSPTKKSDLKLFAESLMNREH